jgi:hypothetical protein
MDAVSLNPANFGSQNVFILLYQSTLLHFLLFFSIPSYWVAVCDTDAGSR